MDAWHSGLIYADNPTVLGSYQYHNLNVLTNFCITLHIDNVLFHISNDLISS